MNTRRGAFVNRIVAMALVIAMTSPYAYAADVGKVTYVEGRVDVSRQGSDLATPLREGDPIAIGDAVRTKSNSKAEITFNDKSALRLAQNTRIEVKDYVLDEQNKRKTADIMVDRGKVRTIIEKMPGLTEFNISTPNAKGTVHGSDVFTSFQAGSSNMLVAEGRLSVMNPSLPRDVLIIPAGNSVVVPQNEMPKGPRAYLDIEKQLQEQDTAIPMTVSRDPNSTVIKGAIAAMSGDVRVTLKGTGETRKATINDILGEGDTIETGKDGLVEIKLDNGNGLNLKQDSKVTITKLAQDPKTGQYENKFDASMGKVRARIEKLKETKSTFEVRTPTAVCGARGTLMYIEIGPKMTRCFFEGGLGDLSSALSSMRREIEMGHAAYSDSEGNLSQQYIPGDGERLDWTSSWDPGNGTEGYASPGGTVYITNANGSIGGTAPDIGTEFQDFFNDPLFPIEGTATVKEVTSSGSFYGSSDYYGSGSGTLEGIIALTGSFWNGDTAVLEGSWAYDYTDNDYSKFIWFGGNGYSRTEDETVNEGFLYSYDPDLKTYNTYDDGSFYGNAVGIGDSVIGIMDGLVKLLYIDPSGNAGIVGGIIDNGVLLGGGYVFTSDLVSEFEVAGAWIGTLPTDYRDWVYITPQDAGHLYGDFADGYIDGYDYLYTMSIVNRENNTAANWGIYYQQYYAGSYGGTIPADWKAKMGGTGIFGAYYSSAFEDFTDDDGYWIADIEDGKWDNNKLTATLTGTFLTHTKIGNIAGNILGTYDEYGSWQAVGIGAWGTDEKVSGALKFVSDVYLSFYNDGSYQGLMGGIKSLWTESGSPSLTLIASSGYDLERSSFSETSYNAQTWRSDSIYSYNYVIDSKGSYTTYDETPGAYYGYMRGNESDGDLNGRFLALYIDPQGNAGILDSSLTGKVYGDIGMIEILDNSISVIQEALAANVGIAASDLSTYEDYSENTDYISGSFTVSGNRITADSYLYTYSLFDYANYTAQGWGIYTQDISYGDYYMSEGDSSFKMVMGGYDIFGAYIYEYEDWDGSTYTDYSGDYGYWIASADGSFENDDYTLGATVSGRFMTYTKMGNMDGSIFGAYDGYSSWNGFGIGVWGTDSEKSGALEFSGLWNSNDTEGGLSSLYVNYYGYAYEIGEEYGFIGSLSSPWAGSGTVTAIGEYYIDETGYSCIWSSPIESYNAVKDDYTTIDGGAFFGFSAGLWKDGDIKGTIYALYIDPDGNVGYLKSDDLTGSYYENIGMWEADGTLEAVQKFAETGIDPADFIRLLTPMGMDEAGFPINYDNYDSEFSGSFNGDGEIYGYVWNEQMYGISDMRIGVFSLMFDDYDGWNYYTRNDDSSTTWSIGTGGTSEGDSNSYWYLSVNGNWDSDGTLDGTLKGASISETTLTTLIGGLYGTYDADYIDSRYDEDTGERYYYYEEGYWIGSAVGYVEENQLAWSAKANAQFNYFDYDGDEVIYTDSESYLEGIMGTLISPFENVGQAVPVTMVGDAYSSGLSYVAWGYLSGSFAGDGSHLPDGFIGAASDLNDTMKGILAALYIDADGFAGTLIGAFTGQVMPDSGIWQMEGTATATQRASGFGEEYSTANNYIDGMASGTFGGDTIIDMPYGIYDMSYGSLTSYTVSLKDPGTGDPLGWGIYNIELGGYYTGAATDSWKMALSGSSWQEADMFWVSSIKGDQWSEGLISGDMKGVWIKEGMDGNVVIGSIQGKVVGSEYVEVEGESGTWQAISAGEWVEVSDLLDQKAMFGANGIEELNRFVNVPITEVYSNILTQVGAGSVGVGNGVMVQNIADFLNFVFSRWENSQWVADYNGSTGGAAITGQAGGTFANGAFNGVGAGINQDILNTVAITGNYGPDGAITNTTADVTLYTPTVTPPVGD